MACSTPVVLIIFNRADLTAQVFAAIRRAQPAKLLVVADGPRSPAEKQACQAVRKVVEQVDWTCEVKTEFADTNLGCGRRPATGLDWVFSQVEEAIILEDDCLPAPSFFPFCESLLEYYRHDRRIMHIGGSNVWRGPQVTPASYYFSRYTLSWGWATWKRAWQFYDFKMKTWPEFRGRGLLDGIFPDPIECRYWKKKLSDLSENGREDAWDYQWNYAVWTQGALSILPTVNLISNIGFRPDATHTRTPTSYANLPVGESGPMVHPPFVVPDRAADRCTFNERFGGNRIRNQKTWKYRLTKPARLLRGWLRNENSTGV